MEVLTEAQRKHALATLKKGIEATSLKEPQLSRALELAIHYGTLKDSMVPDKAKTTLRMIDEAWHAMKRAIAPDDPAFANIYGLKAIYQKGDALDNSILAAIESAKSLRIAGEHFRWIKNEFALIAAIRNRVASGLETRFLTPHPDFKPEPNRDIRLKSVLTLIFNEQWEMAKAVKHGNVVAQATGVPRLFGYAAAMTDRFVWVFHELGASRDYETIFQYEKTQSPLCYYRAIEQDIDALVPGANPDRDLIERYRPR